MCISYNNQSIYYTIFHKESSKLRISEHQYKGDRKPRVKQSGACFTPVTTAELWNTTTYKTMKSNVYYTWSFFYLDATMGQLFKSLTDDFDFYNSNSFCAHFKKEVYNIFLLADFRFDFFLQYTSQNIRCGIKIRSSTKIHQLI